VLFGDSHAHHLFDGLNAAVQAEGWELRVYTKNSCPPIDVPVYDSKMRGEDKSCTIWRESIIQRLLTDKPDAVIIASWTGLARKLSEATTGERLSTAASMALWQRGFEQVLSRLTGAGINVIVVRDTPRSQARYGSACLDRLIESECATPRPQAIDAETPDVMVAKRIPGVRVLDLTDRFCGRNSCPAVKDGNVVYRGDDNHLTATFSRTLAPAFLDVLIETGSLPASKRK
jgi:ABC-type Fe3+-hydroxamate transport system substrate-binding protein